MREGPAVGACIGRFDELQVSDPGVLEAMAVAACICRRQRLQPAARQRQQPDVACGLDVISFSAATAAACMAKDPQGELASRRDQLQFSHL
eukprot:687105-Karenia_brevis.AAC.1